MSKTWVTNILMTTQTIFPNCFPEESRGTFTGTKNTAGESILSARRLWWFARAKTLVQIFFSRNDVTKDIAQRQMGWGCFFSFPQMVCFSFPGSWCFENQVFFRTFCWELDRWGGAKPKTASLTMWFMTSWMDWWDPGIYTLPLSQSFGPSFVGTVQLLVFVCFKRKIVFSKTVTNIGQEHVCLKAWFSPKKVR